MEVPASWVGSDSWGASPRRQPWLRVLSSGSGDPRTPEKVTSTTRHQLEPVPSCSREGKSEDLAHQLEKEDPALREGSTRHPWDILP